MNERQQVQISKLLSKHLRHEPEVLGLTLEPGGWVAVDALLDAAARKGMCLTRCDLESLVAESDKQRFALDESGGRIRANQGHSVEVDLQLVALEPPAILFHGTVARFLDAIMAEGLKPMSRHHVHLSSDQETARKVGARRGKPVVLCVDAAAMHCQAHVFYRSENGVWLTDAVAPQFLNRTSPLSEVRTA